MYHWVTDKKFLGNMKIECSDAVNRLVQLINAEGKMKVKQHLVGSGDRNMILQNAKEPIDLDYNLEIIDFGVFSVNDCRGIKRYVQQKFDEVLQKKNWGHCQDSTSALTTIKKHFKTGNQTPFKIDLCITYKSNDGHWMRLIHEKTGYAASDQYIWNSARDSRGLNERIMWLQENDHWDEVRERYMEKKNMYLRRGDHEHPSFIEYVEAVNEVYAEKQPRKTINGLTLLASENTFSELSGYRLISK